MADVTYVQDMDLYLYVWDSGIIDSYGVFIDGTYTLSSNALVRKYPLARPTSPARYAVVVNFAGEDGGATKIVDEKQKPPVVVAFQRTGMSHGYTVKI